MIEYKITEHIATISQRGEWYLELNRVKWNNGEEKLDLRAWSSDHLKCSKGITLTNGEAKTLRGALAEI